MPEIFQYRYKVRPEDIDAHIVLQEGDKTPVDSWLPRPVVINLPPGKDLRLVTVAPTINFKLEKRSAAPPGP